MNIKQLQSLSKQNNICVDCSVGGTKWASIQFGVYICLECAGNHRSLGAHITNVRSIDLDLWQEKHLVFMDKGGNAKFQQFVEKYPGLQQMNYSEKYRTKAMQFYKKFLKSQIDNIQLQEVEPPEHEGLQLVEQPPKYQNFQGPKKTQQQKNSWKSKIIPAIVVLCIAIGAFLYFQKKQ